MALFTASLLLLSIFSASCAGSPSQYHSYDSRRVSTSTPLPPTEDPFYNAPLNFEAAEPGTILRMRPAPGNIGNGTINVSSVYNILYRTTDSRYRPTWAVTTLMIPPTPQKCENTTGNCALLTYSIAYDAVDLDASPSFALNSLFSNTSTAPEKLEIAMSLTAGFYVNIPDYEGPLASFTSGTIAGHATLDSIRAVLSAGFGLGETSHVRSALWGYSGGALACEWAAELHIQYAPELTFSGAALGGLTPDIETVMTVCNAASCAGLLPAGILGLATQWPDFRALVGEQLETTGPFNATAFFTILNMTANEAELAFFNISVLSFFKDGSQLIKNPILQNIFKNDGRMTYHGIPQMPIFAYKAIADEVSPINDTDALVARFCSNGVNIEYQRNTIGGHGADQFNGMQNAFAFLQAVQTGVYVPHGCTMKTTEVNVTSSPF